MTTTKGTLAKPLGTDAAYYVHADQSPAGIAALADLRALMAHAAAVEAEREWLRAALVDCGKRARRLMESQGYTEDDNGAWVGPDLHAICDHADLAECGGAK